MVKYIKNRCVEIYFSLKRLISFLSDDLNPNPLSKKLWMNLAKLIVGISSALISFLVISPLFTYYSESTNIGQVIAVAFFLVLAFIFELLIPKRVRSKRYIILIKILTLPSSVLGLFIIKNIQIITETLHDRPKSSNSNIAER